MPKANNFDFKRLKPNPRAILVYNFFRRYPLFLNFLPNGKKFIFADSYKKEPQASQKNKLVDFFSTKLESFDPLPELKKHKALDQFARLSLEDYTKTILPNEPKFRKLMQTSLTDLQSFWNFSPNIWEAKKLIELQVNKDIVFNYLEKKIQNVGKEPFQPCSEIVIKYLIANYSPQRVCELLFSTHRKDDDYCLDDLSTGITQIKNENLPPASYLPKAPKDLEEVHDSIYAELEVLKSLKKQRDYPLNPREDFLKFDNLEFDIGDEKFKVIVPKTRKELAEFSRKKMFNNCVGTSDSYAEGVKNGKWSILGIFSALTNEPRYCIQAQKYSFLQAKGISNSEIPKEVLYKLQNILTTQPVIPSDFISVEHSFIGGYKYNPESQSFFLLFKKNLTIYEYQNVKVETYEEFANAKSKGTFFQQFIRGEKYPYQKVS